MVHGGHGKRREEAGKLARKGNKSLLPVKKQDGKKDQKKSSIKNQMRSIQRLLMKKNLSSEVKCAQQKRLEDLKSQADQNHRAALERKMSLRYRRVKFFERRKIERAMKRLEKVKEAGSEVLEKGSMTHNPDTTEQLAQLKEDLEYVRFFPKTEKYVSLFMGQDDEEVIAKRSKLRDQIKANLAAAAAAGVEPDEMENDEEQAMEVSDDDFFLAASSGDDVEADSKWTLTKSRSETRKDHSGKKLPVSSSRHTSGQKDYQQSQRPQNSSCRLQMRDQWPHSTGKSYKNKKSHFRDDERIQSQMGIHKNKKQKTTLNRPLSGSSLPSYNSSQPAFNNTFKSASSTLSSKNNAGPCSVPSSRINSDVGKKSSIPEVDSLNMDVQKKRRRKHRPKKKKT